MNAVSDGRYFVPSVGAAARLLFLLRDRGEAGASLSEISRELSTPKSTCFNIVRTLRGFELVETMPGTRQYRLGPAVAELASSSRATAHYPLVAHHQLVALSRETGLTTVLAQRVGAHLTFLDKVEGEDYIRVTADVGQLYPAVAGSLGKALIAYLDDATLGDLLAEGLARYTDSTLASSEDLRAELGRVRAHGYAESRGEFVAGVNAVAAPVFDAGGQPILALGILGLASVLGEDRMVEYGVLVRESARAMTLALGGQDRFRQESPSALVKE